VVVQDAIMVDGVVLMVRQPLTEVEFNVLFAVAWPDHRRVRFEPVLQRSLTWITARSGDQLVGFVNVATDGGAHAFLLDTTVHPDVRRHGIGRRLVIAAADQARALGATWLHVDYEPHLDELYKGCGFRPTAVGLLRLTERGTDMPSL
jgi:GNAT superfamily N-acetyltransferase